MTKILGVDAGVRGAYCLIEFPDKNILKINRFERKKTKKGIIKNRLDINNFIDELKLLPDIDIIYLEVPNVIGNNMRIAQAAYFRTLGNIEACLSGCAPIREVKPEHWKKAYNLFNKPKSESTKIAKQIFNNEVIKNADIAEACLIAHYGYNYYTGE